jgi:hypothetical protein
LEDVGHGGGVQMAGVEEAEVLIEAEVLTEAAVLIEAEVLTEAQGIKNDVSKHRRW